MSFTEFLYLGSFAFAGFTFVAYDAYTNLKNKEKSLPYSMVYGAILGIPLGLACALNVSLIWKNK
jgi:hypothetical protein